MQFLLGHALLGPTAVQAEDLGHTGPGEVACQIGRGHQMAHIVPSSVSAIDGARVTVVQQGQRPAVRGRIEQQTDVRVEGRLVLFGQEEVVAARVAHLLAEVPLA